MLNLIILYIAFLYCIFSGSFIVNFLGYKCLGMQTLYDRVLVNILQFHMLFVTWSTILCTCGTFQTDWDPLVAKILATIYLILSTNDGLSLACVPIIRYLLVFHGTLFYKTTDDEVIKILRITNAILAVILVAFDLFINGYENLYSYGILTNPDLKNPTYNPASTQGVFSIAIIAFTILQIRLEILNYKYGEGFLIQLKKWWHNKHQDETSENEEYGINFQRIMIFMIAIMSIFFFAGTNQYSQDQKFFGYIGRVSTSLLIQIIVVDLLWTMVIIQNPMMRKRLFNLVTCKSETVQIVKF